MSKTTKKTEGIGGGGPLAYCGPTIPGVAKQCTIYTGGIPTPLVAAIEEHPVLGSLVVSLDRLPEVLRHLREGYSRYFTLFRKAQEIN